MGHTTHAGSGGEHYRTLCPRFCRGRGDEQKAYSGASEAVCPIADLDEIFLIHPIRPFATLVFRLTGRRRFRGHQYAKAKAKLISQRPIARTPMQTPPLLMAAQDRGALMRAHVRHDAGPARRKTNSRIQSIERKAVGTAEAETGRMTRIVGGSGRGRARFRSFLFLMSLSVGDPRAFGDHCHSLTSFRANLRSFLSPARRRDTYSLIFGSEG